MRRVNLKLNPAKCVFGVHKCKVLGSLVSAKGIEANPDKIKSIVNMRPPQNQKVVQKLTGRIAALNRFIARSAEWSLPFFTVLRGANKFEWGEPQQKAFEELKEYLSSLTTLSSPEPNEPLLL
jgi:hypothetical protein